jgi:hypothetical protein
MVWRFYLLTTEGGTPLYLRLDVRREKQVQDGMDCSATESNEGLLLLSVAGSG